MTFEFGFFSVIFFGGGVRYTECRFICVFVCAAEGTCKERLEHQLSSYVDATDIGDNKDDGDVMTEVLCTTAYEQFSNAAVNTAT